MKLTEVQLLKNFKVFALQARYQTALVYRNKLDRKNLKPNNRKLMMMRILEEFVSATEDLAMWLIAFSKQRQSKNHGLLDQLLMADVPTRLSTSKKKKNKNTDEVVKALQNFNRVTTSNGLLKKMSLVSIDKLAVVSGLTIQELDELLKTVLETIRLTIDHRKKSTSILVRFHNKIKHGMTIFLDPEDIESLIIVDVQRNKHTRFMNLSVNIEKADLAIKNIDSIAKTIGVLIEIELLDYKYRIKNDKELTKRKKRAVLEHIDKVEF